MVIRALSTYTVDAGFGFGNAPAMSVSSLSIQTVAMESLSVHSVILGDTDADTLDDGEYDGDCDGDWDGD